MLNTFQKAKSVTLVREKKNPHILKIPEHYTMLFVFSPPRRKEKPAFAHTAQRQERVIGEQWRWVLS